MALNREQMFRMDWRYLQMITTNIPEFLPKVYSFSYVALLYIYTDEDFSNFVMNLWKWDKSFIGNVSLKSLLRRPQAKQRHPIITSYKS